MNRIYLQRNFGIIFILFMLFSASFSTTELHAQTINPVKARKLFIEHFMKYILWPKEDFQKDFVISVYQDDKIYKELKGAFEEKNFRGRTVFVKKTINQEDLKGSAIVYIPELADESIEGILQNLENSHALVITNIYEEGKKGSSINFIEKNGGLSFELDLAITEKSGLKVYSQLRQLATLL